MRVLAPRASAAAAMLALAAVLAAMGPAPNAPARIACKGTWAIQPSPAPGTYSDLKGIDARSSTDVWAVGFYAGTPSGSLTEHWDGVSWKKVPSPHGINDSASLSGVSASPSSADVWAVGNEISNQVVDGSHVNKTLVIHWDGSSWSRQPSPNVGIRYNALEAVDALSATDAWAVGNRRTASHGYLTLIEHWDGTGWEVVPSPNGTGENFLVGVAAVSANDVWAVGRRVTNGVLRTLIEHWDGVSWQRVPSPNVGTSHNQLRAVVALGPNNVWAVGHYDDTNFVNQPLIERWNGTKWVVKAAASPGPSGGGLSGVAAVSPGDLWAVGTPLFGPTHVIVESYDGTAWQLESAPDPGSGHLAAATATPDGYVWGAGGFNDGSSQQGLIEAACGV